MILAEILAPMVIDDAIPARVLDEIKVQIVALGLPTLTCLQLSGHSSRQRLATERHRQ
jgi:hypothetical protein